jgi:hypothetical protein
MATHGRTFTGPAAACLCHLVGVAHAAPSVLTLHSGSVSMRYANTEVYLRLCQRILHCSIQRCCTGGVGRVRAKSGISCGAKCRKSVRRIQQSVVLRFVWKQTAMLDTLNGPARSNRTKTSLEQKEGEGGHRRCRDGLHVISIYPLISPFAMSHKRLALSGFTA